MVVVFTQQRPRSPCDYICCESDETVESQCVQEQTGSADEGVIGIAIDLDVAGGAESCAKKGELCKPFLCWLILWISYFFFYEFRFEF